MIHLIPIFRVDVHIFRDLRLTLTVGVAIFYVIY